MAASETLEKPQDSAKQSQPTEDQDKRPCGTMFDPETIRKFLEQIKKDNK